MKLELNIFDIENIRFGEKTAINEGILSIDRKALQDLVLDLIPLMEDKTV